MVITQLALEMHNDSIKGKRRTMKVHFLIVFVLFMYIIAPVCAAQVRPDPFIAAYTSNLPFVMPPIQMPNIPNYRIAITEFGAVGDGNTMNTQAIARAIQECVKKGGGVVNVPPGLWLTGPIRLESNIEMHLDSGAMILFSKRFEDFPMFARPKSSNYRCMPMVYGSNLENVAMTGKGMMNGNGQYWRPVKKEKMTERQWKQLLASGGALSADGKMWWPSKEALNGEEYLKNLRKMNKKPSPEEIAGAREFLRPVMVALDNCRRVLLDGPTFTNSPAWALQPAQCEDVVMRNVTVSNPWWGQNTDGIDINSCRNVLLYNSVVDAGDDAICIKAGKPNEAHANEPACENIVVADCIVYHGHGGFVIGSESYGGARNISLKNCTFVGTDIGLRFKSAKDRGGVVEKIYVDGIRMKDIATTAILFDMVYEGNNDNDPSKVRIPQFRDFHIRNIVCDGAADAIFIRGIPEMAVKGIHFDDISITSDKGCLIQDADGIDIRNLRVSFNHGPVCLVNNARNIQLQNISFPQGTELFLKASGGRTEGISVLKSDISKAKRDVEMDSDVQKDAVVVQ